MPISIARAITAELDSCIQAYPVVTITGPRQSGKTTLARTHFPDKPYINLEIPDERELAIADPHTFFQRLPDGAILDEIQRAPILLSYIQAIVDEKQINGLFVVTGSQQASLHEAITQSLAGRTAMLHLYPLSLRELQTVAPDATLEEQLFSGGYPRIYRHAIAPKRYYRDYVQTYLERDVRQMIKVQELEQFQRFLFLCASRSAQLIDYTSLSNELGIARKTVKEWLSVLKASFIITILPPYFENFGKRVIKSPKLYFTDVGLLCYLLGIQEPSQLQRHPLRGALFETLVVTELLKQKVNAGEEPRLHFYRDNHQREIDVLYRQGDALIAIEIKSSQTFHQVFVKQLDKFKQWVSDYRIESYVVYAGDNTQTVNGHQLLNYRQIADYF